jgi:hypothetical protein
MTHQWIDINTRNRVLALWKTVEKAKLRGHALWDIRVVRGETHTEEKVSSAVSFKCKLQIIFYNVIHLAIVELRVTFLTVMY